MVLDEPTENDNIYDMSNFKFVVAKEEEKDSPFLEIDYIEYSWGPEYVVTAIC